MGYVYARVRYGMCDDDYMKWKKAREANRMDVCAIIKSEIYFSDALSIHEIADKKHTHTQRGGTIGYVHALET